MCVYIYTHIHITLYVIGHGRPDTGQASPGRGGRRYRRRRGEVPALGRGNDTVGNPHRAQISQFELFELNHLTGLNKLISIEQFEPIASQSAVSSPPLLGKRLPKAKSLSKRLPKALSGS